MLCCLGSSAVLRGGGITEFLVYAPVNSKSNFSQMLSNFHEFLTNFGESFKNFCAFDCWFSTHFWTVVSPSTYIIGSDGYGLLYSLVFPNLSLVLNSGRRQLSS